MRALVDFLFRFKALLVKELIQFVKNPKTRITVLAPPVLQLFLLGYAATLDLKEVPFAVLDHARTVESRALVDQFRATDIFVERPAFATEKEIEDRLDAHETRLALVIPEDFSRNLATGRPADVQLIVDGRNSFSAGTASGYAADVIAAFNVRHAPGSAPPVRVTSRGWGNPNYDAQWYMVPSLLAVLSLLALTLLVALSFAKEREGGTMDQLLMTPYAPTTLLAAKGLASMIVGYLQLLFAMVFVIFWFRVPYSSSYGLLFLLFTTFLLASVGLGLLLSIFCKTLQQAMISVFIVAVPFAMLSGLATPVDSMPDILQKAMALNPIRWGIVALHRLFLEGGAFADLWPTYAILTAIGLAGFTLACLVFARQRRV